MSFKQYRPGSAFPGRIGLTADQSSPAWQRPVRAPFDAPNVVIIVLDDVGFAHLGCYGSPIRTTTFDRLARGGLRYVGFQTAGLSSPTRSCILTGRNHHSNGMGAMPEVASGYPGYDAVTPFSNGFLSEMLREVGYTTLAVGKWHLTPPEQLGAAGPYERWPLGRGFDRYYGFLGGDTSQYYPDLVYDNHQILPPATPEEGYHLTPDLVDRAIDFVADTKQVAPDRPFFLYLAPGACHAPHQVPREWSDKYRFAFDAGWETYREEALGRQKKMGIVPDDAGLSHLDPDVPRWPSLSDDQRRIYARTMEVFAGFLEHADHHVGRLIDFLDSIGELDNTLTIVVSDNGASPEGGPTASIHEARYFNRVPETLSDDLAALDGLGGPEFFNHYHWGWAHAGNTPFRRWKRETYLGGVSDPCIVYWPAGFAARGEIRRQYVHAIDLSPTVLDAVGIDPPRQIRGVSQTRLHGVSFRHTFDDPEANSLRGTQYFELFAHRALYHEGWRAVCPFPGRSYLEASEHGYDTGQAFTIDRLREREEHGWELYHVQRDIAERFNLASRHPDRLRELIAIWYAEAGRYGVLPLHGPDNSRFLIERPQEARSRKRYVYFPRTQAVPDHAAVNVLNRAHVITAEVDVPEDGAEGVLLSHGGNVGGYTLFVMDGRLHYVHNYVGVEVHHLVSTEAVPRGRSIVTMRFDPTGEPDLENGRGTPGRATLEIDGVEAGSLDMPVTLPILIAVGEGLTCGWDSGSPTTGLYRPPFRFTGRLHRVTVEVEGDPVRDPWATFRRARARE